MKIGLISDSHDHLIKINEAVKYFNWEKVEHVIHCGDFVAPFALKLFANLDMPITAIFGNNDGEKKGLSNCIKDLCEVQEPPICKIIGGKKFVISHSPIPDNVMDKYDSVDYVISGHTHEKKVYGEFPLFINPGEACGWLTGLSTVAILDTETKDVEFKIL